MPGAWAHISGKEERQNCLSPFHWCTSLWGPSPGKPVSEFSTLKFDFEKCPVGAQQPRFRCIATICKIYPQLFFKKQTNKLGLWGYLAINATEVGGQGLGDLLLWWTLLALG